MEKEGLPDAPGDWGRVKMMWQGGKNLADLYHASPFQKECITRHCCRHRVDQQCALPLEPSLLEGG